MSHRCSSRRRNLNSFKKELYSVVNAQLRVLESTWTIGNKRREFQTKWLYTFPYMVYYVFHINLVQAILDLIST